MTELQSYVDEEAEIRPELLALPQDLRARIHWGLFNGEEQYYISGVDGTLGRLGNNLPSTEMLRKIVATADVEHVKLLRTVYP